MNGELEAWTGGVLIAPGRGRDRAEPLASSGLRGGRWDEGFGVGDAEDGGVGDPDGVSALVSGYEQVFSTLADYVRVLTLDTTTFELPSAG
jgi:hypothetical protein